MFVIKNHMRDYSRKSTKLYGIFKPLEGQELADFQENLQLPPELSDEEIEFASTHTLLSVVSSKEEFNIFLTLYFVSQHADHFERWAPLHGFEDDPDSLEAATAYVDALAADDPHVFDHDFVVCKWVYNGSAMASMLRMFFGCMPLGCSFEDDREINYYAQNMARGITETLQAFSADQLSQLLTSAGLSVNTIADEFFENDPEMSPESTSTEPPCNLADAPAEAPKKKRGRPRKNPETTPEKGE